MKPEPSTLGGWVEKEDLRLREDDYDLLKIDIQIGVLRWRRLNNTFISMEQVIPKSRQLGN
jgi:hypothetical protein